MQFPLAEEGSLPSNYGSRHRAALGLAAESDCVVVIVSEETGRIGIAVNGTFEMQMNQDELRKRLRELLSNPTSAIDMDQEQPPMVDTDPAGLESPAIKPESTT